jgi:hypothetical protein
LPKRLVVHRRRRSEPAAASAGSGRSRNGWRSRGRTTRSRRWLSIRRRCRCRCLGCGRCWPLTSGSTLLHGTRNERCCPRRHPLLTAAILRERRDCNEKSDRECKQTFHKSRF